jgi:hypothetical protein
MMDKSKLDLAKQLLEQVSANLAAAKQLLSEATGENFMTDYQGKTASLSVSQDGKIIEGVFDGENMIDKDGKKYPVPANYASKSKLVQGDVLKLTIGVDGSFIYKQIGPVERKKLIGTLVYEDENYKVIAGGKSYKVLLASVTYYKLKEGDQLTIMVPKEGRSEWAAVESAVIEPGLKEIPLEEEKKPKRAKKKE